MKKSEFKAQIKEKIINMLEATKADVQLQKDLNAELAKTKQLAGELMSEEDEEPTAKQLKGDSVATIANKLQQTTKEMKSTVNKWKTAEGEEKQKLRDKLLKLTNIKKELESML